MSAAAAGVPARSLRDALPPAGFDEERGAERRAAGRYFDALPICEALRMIADHAAVPQTLIREGNRSAASTWRESMMQAWHQETHNAMVGALDDAAAGRVYRMRAHRLRRLFVSMVMGEGGPVAMGLVDASEVPR